MEDAMIPQKQPNILETIKKKGTFQVNPDEEQFILDASAGGLKEEQIIKGLTIKRQDVATGLVTPPEEVEGTVDIASGEEMGEVTQDPFAGKSKQEVLKLAFMSGITNKSALKDISDTYDMVMGDGEQTDEQKKEANYSKAQMFIEDNPDASREELRTAIMQHTDLDTGGIDSLLEGGGIKKREEMFTDEELKEDATALVRENASNVFSDKKKGLEAAIQAVEEDTSYSPSEKKKMLGFIQEEYPEGRSFLDRLLPGGK